MNKVFTLSRVLRKCGKAGDDSSGSQKKQSDVITIVFCIIALILLFLLGKIVADSKGAIDINAVVPVLCFFVGLILFFLGIIRLINGLYMSSDLGILTTMPFSSFELAVVRLINASYLHFGISFVTLLPFTLAYGIFASAAPIFYIGMVISAILIPIFSTCLSAVVVMFFFTVFRWARNKDLISIIGVMFSLLLCCGIIYAENKGMNAGSNVDIQAVITQVLSMFINYTKIIPPVYFLGLFIKDQNFLNLLFALLITLASFLLFFVFSKLFYLKGALAMQTTLSNNKVLDEKALIKATKKHSPVNSYVKKELRMLRRNPAYLMNCFIMTFVWPIFFLIIMAVGGNSIFQMAADPQFFGSSSFLMALGFGLFIPSFITSLNYIGVISISREGQSFFYMKSMPITYHDQIKAKRRVALLICNLGTTLYIFIGLTIFAFLGRIAFWAPLYAAVVSFLINFILVDIQMMRATASVNLDWDSETQAMQTMFPLAQMFIALTIAGMIFVIPMMAITAFLVPVVIVIIGVVVILAVLAFIFEKWMYKFTRRKMNYL